MTTTLDKSELGRALQALRSDYSNNGRPKTLRKCPFCKLKFGAREMRAHKCPIKAHMKTATKGGAR